ncbi:O-Antigen ligase [Marinobacter litoralis]|uniref:O-Antigen ligase n=1 Tax=Marinobacter litoralis TaxID=187981 RepID=A0A3M2RF85_9GAMM|nr:O-antigen ligase family protein [Marinobacter litoralis]RMJ03952.1 O-Antigen ligase [Marinobacter litoralis]
MAFDSRPIEWSWTLILSVLLVVGVVTISLFGQYLMGPPNIHSARALVMLLEVSGLILWLVNKPQALLVGASMAIRLCGVLLLVTGTAGVFFAAHNWGAAIIGQIEWIAHFLVLVALVDVYARGRLSLEGVLLGICVAGLLAISFFAFRWIQMENPADFNWFWGAYPFLHIRHFAFLILPAAISAFYFAVSAERIAKCFGIVSMTVLLAALFWAGGRASVGAALIALLVGLLFVATTAHRGSFFKLLLQVLIVTSAAAAISELFSVNHPGMGLSFNHGREVADTVDAVSSGRLSIWFSVVDNMTWQQWLFGHGVDNYRYLPNRYDETVHPHSWFFQALSAWGALAAVVLVGGLWALTLRVIYMQFRIKDRSKPNDLLFFSGLILLSYLVLSLVDGNFYHSWGVLLLLPLLAACFCNFYRISATTAQSKSLASGWLYGVAAIIVAVVVQIVNVTTIFRGSVPAPNDWRSQVVLAVPYNTILVANWLEPWQQVDQNEMLRLLRWLQTYSADKYRFMLIESEMLLQEGYKEASLNMYEKAVNSAPARAKKKLIELGPPEL